MLESAKRVGFDEDRSEQFGNRLFDAFNQMGLALMLSIGQKTGLLEWLAGQPPSTSQEIALVMGLHERYVYEWLACLATAEVLTYEPEVETFVLQPEHAVWLTGLAAFNPGARFTDSDLLVEAFALLMDVQPQVIDCFQRGGGVLDSAYGPFHELMARSRNAHFDGVLLESIVPFVPGWGTAMAQGAQVADFGCGRGHALMLLAQMYPQSQFTGYDISLAEIDQGRSVTSQRGLVNLCFHQADVCGVAVEGAYEYALALDMIHDLTWPAAGLQTIRRSLKPDGWLLMQEFAASSRLEENLDHPLGTWLYAQSVMYCMTVSLSQGRAGLGCMWGREAILAMLAQTDFGEVRVKRLEADLYSDYFVARVPAAG